LSFSHHDSTSTGLKVTYLEKANAFECGCTRNGGSSGQQRQTNHVLFLRRGDEVRVRERYIGDEVRARERS
jgi:hypothetical protein